MSKDPVSIPIQAPIQDALTLMEDRTSQITVLPITKKDGKTCIGLLRLHDIYQTRLF
jgi:arabinose-5-phosphate isomerase